MTLGARLGRAIFWGQAGRLAEAAVYFLFYLFLARALGPASYGLFALGISLAGVCGFLTLLGLGPETLGRFLPEIAANGRRAGARRLLGMLLAVRGAAILVLSGLVFFFRRDIVERFHFSPLTVSLLLVLVVFAARSTFDLLIYFASGLLDLKRVAAAKLVASLTAPALFLVFWSRHISGVHAAWLATASGLLAGTLFLALPSLASGGAATFQTKIPLPLGRILAFGMFAWATNFFVYILGDNMDVLLLGWLVADRAAIGYYAVGARIVFSLIGLLLGWASLASVAACSEALQQGGIGKLVQAVEAQWKLGVLCLVAPLFFLIRYAREIIAICYSAAYAPSVPVVQILCGLMACSVVLGFSLGTSALYAVSHERLACAVVAAAAAFNVLSEVLLVRRYGILGAALATGSSFILLAILSAVMSRFYIPWRFPAAFIAKVVSAGGLALMSTLWLRADSIGWLALDSLMWAAVFLASLALLKPLAARDSVALGRVHPCLAGIASRFSPRATITTLQELT